MEVLSQNFGAELQKEAAELKRLEADLQQRIQHLPLQEQNAIRFSEDEFYRTYHRYDAISNYLEQLRETHRNMVIKEVIGETIEKRQIIIYKIHSPGAYDDKKPALFINCAQHAREWIAPPVGNYIFLKLLSTYNSDPRVKAILDAINVFYVPIVNIDGFLYTQQNRMWRKNRRLISGSTYGVDLNRNWKSGFGGAGSSNVPSSETYRGTAALSEPESRAMSNFMNKHPQIKAGIDFHSYSQLNLRPWGKSYSASPDEAKLRGLGLKMVDAIKAVHGVSYQNIPASGLYIASGILCDEFYENHKAMGYTIELRPTQFGGGGFAPPPSQILPTVQENWAATLALADYVRTGQF
jgi:carboxypeptidase A5